MWPTLTRVRSLGSLAVSGRKYQEFGKSGQWDAFLDTQQLEKKRITIFLMRLLTTDDAEITLIRQARFCFQTEEVLSVLDYAILVIYDRWRHGYAKTL